MGHEYEKNLKKAYDFQKIRKKGEKIPKSAKQPSYLYYYDMCLFSKQIKRYFDLFPKKQIKVILFDDFIRNTKNIYKETLMFVGCKNTNYKFDFKNKNPAKMPLNRKFQQLIRNPNNKIKFMLKKLLNKKTQDKIYKILMKINSKKRKYNVSSQDKKDIMKDLKPEVKNLNKLLHDYKLISKDVDLLNLWGYRKK
jgi:hypothetical protein